MQLKFRETWTNCVPAIYPTKNDHPRSGGTDSYVLVVLPAFGMRYWYAMTALFMTGMPSTAVK